MAVVAVGLEPTKPKRPIYSRIQLPLWDATLESQGVILHDAAASAVSR